MRSAEKSAKAIKAVVEPAMRALFVALLMLPFISFGATAQTPPTVTPGHQDSQPSESTDLPSDETADIHGLKLGLKAQTMTTDGFGDFACGSNGGPPRLVLDDWTQYLKCKAEANGLHEVYVTFDDEQDYMGRALGDPTLAGQNIGTRVAGHPVILSVLFDDAGTARGIRFVTDPRADPSERRTGYLLGLAIMNHYGTDGWTCTDLPPAAGESPVGGIFIKQKCEKTTPERYMTVETHFLRKPGQNEIDPSTHEYTSGEFESTARFELFDPALKKP